MIGEKQGFWMKEPPNPVGRLVWLACRLVWLKGELVKEAVMGTYRRQVPRVVRGRGAAKRRARSAI